MEAQNFMKFNVVVNYCLVSLSFKFHAHSCINKRAQVVNARVHVISQVRLLTTRACAFMHRSSWDETNFWNKTERRKFHTNANTR